MITFVRTQEIKTAFKRKLKIFVKTNFCSTLFPISSSKITTILDKKESCLCLFWSQIKLTCVNDSVFNWNCTVHMRRELISKTFLNTHLYSILIDIFPISFSVLCYVPWKNEQLDDRIWFTIYMKLVYSNDYSEK